MMEMRELWKQRLPESLGSVIAKMYAPGPQAVEDEQGSADDDISAGALDVRPGYGLSAKRDIQEASVVEIFEHSVASSRLGSLPRSWSNA